MRKDLSEAETKELNLYIYSRTVFHFHRVRVGDLVQAFVELTHPTVLYGSLGLWLTGILRQSRHRK